MSGFFWKKLTSLPVSKVILPTISCELFSLDTPTKFPYIVFPKKALSSAIPSRMLKPLTASSGKPIDLKEGNMSSRKKSSSDAYLKDDYFNLNPKTDSEAIGQLVLANRILAYEGVFDYLGHVSVRNPENSKTFFISRSLAPEQVTRDDIFEVDFEGKVLTQTKQSPYSERIIHGAMYEARQEVNAVVHAHPKEIVILSVLDVPVRIILHTAAVFYEGVPVFDNYDFGSSAMLIKTKEEGASLARHLGKSMASLMRGHGCNVVGENIPRAVRNTIVLRDNVQMQLAAQQQGQIKVISKEEARQVVKHLSPIGTKRGWDYWVSRVKQAMPDLKD